MGILKKSAVGTRVFFASDLHGSTLAFRKFLSAPEFYKVEALVLGGDLTGKQIVALPMGEADEARLERAQQTGSYVWEYEEGERGRLGDDPDFEQDVFIDLTKQRLGEWLALAETVLARSGTPCFVIGGNDDPLPIVQMLREHSGPLLQFCEDDVLPFVDDLKIAGYGWSNQTPWQTPRETSEDEIKRALSTIMDRVEDASSLVLNVHIPPKGTLDTCPALDDTVDPPKPVMKGGQLVYASAGSEAVRWLVTDRQPVLVLCGHIHESRGATRIGDSTVVNPGSEYQAGVLRGALIRLVNGVVKGCQLTSG